MTLDRSANTGFHRYRSVLGAHGHNAPGPEGYDADRIHRRAAMIGFVIDARGKSCPDEIPYVYTRHIRNGESYPMEWQGALENHWIKY